MPWEVRGNCVYKKGAKTHTGCSDSPEGAQAYMRALYAHSKDESIKEEEKLVGGKADNMTPKDIAKKQGVSTDAIKDQIKKGVATEKEHTKDAEKAEEIAKDHLTELPNYYDKLEKMEKKPSKEEKVNEGSETTKSLIKRLIRENLNKK